MHSYNINKIYNNKMCPIVKNIFMFFNIWNWFEFNNAVDHDLSIIW